MPAHNSSCKKTRSIRATDATWAEVRRHAQKTGLGVSTYVREAALKNLSELNGGAVRHELRGMVLELTKIRKGLPERDPNSESADRATLEEVLNKARALLDRLARDHEIPSTCTKCDKDFKQEKTR